jgi:HK97 family phage prohead protease
METKTLPSFTKEIDGRTVGGLSAILGNIDSGGDRIWKGAFKKTIAENRKRFRHLWQHDYFLPPIAAIKDIQEVGRSELTDEVKQKYPEATGALLVVREYLNTERGTEVLEAIKAGALNEMSFSYDPTKWTPPSEADAELGLRRNLRELVLYDTSDVNWGMNEATVASKAAVPYRDTGIMQESADWKTPAADDFGEAGAWEDLPEVEKKRIAAHFGWAGDWPPISFDALKFAHHKPQKRDVGPTVWKAVSAAMAELMRGGADIPADGRKVLYDHLAKHFAEYGKEPPDFKLIELATLSRVMLTGTLKGGHLISEKDVERIHAALQTLNEMLTAAEPPSEAIRKALTEQVAFDIAKREIALRETLLVR